MASKKKHIRRRQRMPQTGTTHHYRDHVVELLPEKKLQERSGGVKGANDWGQDRSRRNIRLAMKTGGLQFLAVIHPAIIFKPFVQTFHQLPFFKALFKEFFHGTAPSIRSACHRLVVMKLDTANVTSSLRETAQVSETRQR